MESWAIENLMQTGAMILAVLIPVIGFTARFALRPIIRDLKELRQAQAQPVGQMDQARLDRMELQLENLESSVERLLEIVEYDRRLEPGEPSEDAS